MLMELVNHRTINIQVKRHNFDNGFSYVEVWHNNRLNDAYFARSEFLFPDGALKQDGIKYFYSPSGEKTNKTLEQLTVRPVEEFEYFDQLRYIAENGVLFDLHGNKIED